MMLLVSGATTTVRRISHARLGTLIVPRQQARPESVIVRGRPWACDNGAFTGFDERLFLRMLDQLHAARVPGCLFIVCPDVVGDSVATLKLFHQWHAQLRRYGFPLAFVGQDGLQVNEVPWSLFDVFFVGGTTEWKLSRHVETLVSYAKAHGKKVHIGRVNTEKRKRHCMRIGADTIDGSKYTRFPDTYIQGGLNCLDRIAAQRLLF